MLTPPPAPLSPRSRPCPALRIQQPAGLAQSWHKVPIRLFWRPPALTPAAGFLAWSRDNFSHDAIRPQAQASSEIKELR